MTSIAVVVIVCSRGESLTVHIDQMKLFNTIAAAAVIGASFIAPNPAEARNGWIKGGCDYDNNCSVKILERSNYPIVNYKYNSRNFWTKEAHCLN